VPAVGQLDKLEHTGDPVVEFLDRHIEEVRVKAKVGLCAQLRVESGFLRDRSQQPSD